MAKRRSEKNRPIVVPPMRGNGEYDQFLAELEVESHATDTPVNGRSQLVELLIAAGAQSLFGRTAPPRTKPRGTNRFGPPLRTRTGEGEKKSE